MEPYLNPADTADHAVPLIYPDPASTFIKAVVPKSIRGETVNIRIINLSGMKMSDFDTEVPERDPVLIDVSRLAQAPMWLFLQADPKICHSEPGLLFHGDTDPAFLPAIVSQLKNTTFDPLFFSIIYNNYDVNRYITKELRSKTMIKKRDFSLIFDIVICFKRYGAAGISSA